MLLTDLPLPERAARHPASRAAHTWKTRQVTYTLWASVSPPEVTSSSSTPKHVCPMSLAVPEPSVAWQHQICSVHSSPRGQAHRTYVSEHPNPPRQGAGGGWHPRAASPAGQGTPVLGTVTLSSFGTMSSSSSLRFSTPPAACSAAACVVGSTGVLHLQVTSKSNGGIKTTLITVKPKIQATTSKRFKCAEAP